MPAKKKTKAKPVKTSKKVVAKKAAKPAKKVIKKIEKKVAKKVTKNPLKTKKKVAAKVVKKAIKKLVKPTKKIVKKTVKKPTKIAVKATKKSLKESKKEVKKISKIAKTKSKAEKVITNKIKIAEKTSEKIIAKAKSNNKAVTESEKEKPVEKKAESQKNLIIVRKSSDSRNRINFKAGEFAVYPSHGVGKIVDIEKTLVLGQDFSCYLMYFEKERLTIKIPVNSAEKIGLRHLVSKSQMDEVFSILRSGVKKLKGMWSRRAQEYETKINSGDIMLLAEVLRDLTRDIEDGDRSYSERIIYETAVNRLAAEYAVIYGIEFEEAKEKIISTAKDKLGIEGKITQKDEFDDFDYSPKNSDDDEDGDDDEEEEEEEDDFDYSGPSDDDFDDEDDDDAPRKKKKKK